MGYRVIGKEPPFIPRLKPRHSAEAALVRKHASAGVDATNEIVAALHATGRFQVSTTTVDGRAMIRLTFFSPRTTEARVAEALDVVADVAARH